MLKLSEIMKISPKKMSITMNFKNVNIKLFDNILQNDKSRITNSNNLFNLINIEFDIMNIMAVLFLNNSIST